MIDTATYTNAYTCNDNTKYEIVNSEYTVCKYLLKQRTFPFA